MRKFKNCKICNKVFYKSSVCSNKQWHNQRKYCSIQCSNNSMKHPKLEKRKRIIKKCLVCNNNFEIIKCREKLAKFCSKKCEFKWRSLSNNHWNWQEGISFKEYPLQWTETLKESIRQRDHHTCQNCGKKQSELKGFHKKLSIHHIDYNKNNLNPNNLISLCRQCHMKTNYNRDYWFAYFTYIMENNNA